MADFVAITVEGTSYTVKDATARESAQNAVSTANQANTTAEQAQEAANQANTAAGQAQQTANSANTAAQAAQTKANQNETDIGSLGEDSLTVSYAAQSESIVFTKGIVIG